MPTTEKSASKTPGTTNSDMEIDDNVAVASFHAGARDEKRTQLDGRPSLGRKASRAEIVLRILLGPTQVKLL